MTITPTSVEITDFAGAPVDGKHYHVDWDAAAAEKGGYPSFMAKEINEQPHAVADTLLGRLRRARPAGARRAAHRRGRPAQRRQDRRHRLRDRLLRRPGREVRASSTGAGSRSRSSWRTSSATATRSSPRRRSWWPSRSPARRWTRSWRSGTPVSRAPGCIAICNTNGSTIPRESDGVLYTHAGPEIAVASTKAFLAQITACYLLGLYLAQLRGTKFADEIHETLRQLHAMPDKIQKVLDGLEQVRADGALDGGHPLGAVPRPARRLPGRHGGRAQAQGAGLHPRRGLRGRRAQARPDRAHRGRASRSSSSCPSPRGRDSLHSKVVSNIQEINARGARTIVIAEEGDDEVVPYADEVIRVPQTPTLLAPLRDRRPAAGLRLRAGDAPRAWTSTSRATWPSPSPSSSRRRRGDRRRSASTSGRTSTRFEHDRSSAVRRLTRRGCSRRRRDARRLPLSVAGGARSRAKEALAKALGCARRRCAGVDAARRAATPTAGRRPAGRTARVAARAGERGVALASPSLAVVRRRARRRRSSSRTVSCVTGPAPSPTSGAAEEAARSPRSPPGRSCSAPRRARRRRSRSRLGGRLTARASSCWSAPATTAATRCGRAPGSPAAVSGWTPCSSPPSLHEEGLAALRAAGGRLADRCRCARGCSPGPTSSSTASSVSAARRACGSPRGLAAGLPARGAPARRSSSPSTCRAGSTPTRVRLPGDARARRRHGDLRRAEAVPAPAARRPRRGPGRGRRHRARCPAARRPGRGGRAAHRRRTSRRCGRCPARGRQVPARGASASSPARPRTPGRPCSASAARCAPAPGWCATSGRSTPRTSSGTAWPEVVVGTGRVQAWALGSGRRPGRRRRAGGRHPCRRCARACRASSTPARSPCSARTPACGRCSARTPCSPRTPASSPGCSPPSGRRRRDRARGGRGATARARPRARRGDRRHGAAQGLDDARRRRDGAARSAASGGRPPGWPRRAPGTCSPASSVPSSAPVSPPRTPPLSPPTCTDAPRPSLPARGPAARSSPGTSPPPSRPPCAHSSPGRNLEAERLDGDERDRPRHPRGPGRRRPAARAARVLRSSTSTPSRPTSRRCAGRAAGAELMAVVKADGYGHGMVPVARAALAGGADRLGVAHLREALELRAAGVDAPVLAWLHGARRPVRGRRARRRRGRRQRRGHPDGGRGRRARRRPDRPGAAQGRHRPLPQRLPAASCGPTSSPRPAPAAPPRAACSSPASSRTSPARTSRSTPASGAQREAFDAAVAAVERAGLPVPLRHMANSAATVLDRACPLRPRPARHLRLRLLARPGLGGAANSGCGRR